MWAAAVAEAKIPANRGPGFRDAGVGPQVDLLVFDGPPQALDEDIVPPGPLALHADLDLAARQHIDELGRGELAALIGVKDLGGAVSRQRLLDGFDAEVGCSTSTILSGRDNHLGRF